MAGYKISLQSPDGGALSSYKSPPKGFPLPIIPQFPRWIMDSLAQNRDALNGSGHSPQAQV